MPVENEGGYVPMMPKMSKKRITIGVIEFLAFLVAICAADAVNVPLIIISLGVAFACSQYLWVVPASQERNRKYRRR